MRKTPETWCEKTSDKLAIYMSKKFTNTVLLILGILFVLVFGMICKQSGSVKKEVEQNKNKPILDTLPSDPEPVYTSDSNLVKKMKPLFRIKNDEYSGLTYYHHKTSPVYINRNGVFCYIVAKGNLPYELRFSIQYMADEWLFIQKYIFLIDGVPYEYDPKNIERDNGDGDIWEWSDKMVSVWDKELINALRVAKKVKIKYEGRQYYKDKVLPDVQLKALRDVCDMYEAMGGGVIAK